MVVVIALMIGYDIAKTPSRSVTPASSAESYDDVPSDKASPNDQTYVSRLSPGIISEAPDESEIPRIDSVPWKSMEIRVAYKEAEYASCEMLPAGVLVYAPPQTQENEQARKGMRIAPLTIRLAIDDQAKTKLPASTRNQIISYLRDHQIAVEPTVYRNAEGQAYFGGTCGAAFYQTQSPGLTIAAEPMVRDCMGRIRVLGVLKGEDSDDARTLVLAVRYAMQDQQIISQTAGSKYETELLFFHLAKELNVAAPHVSVFVTSEGRRNLHHLDVTSIGREAESALMTTQIRFDSFVMMGLYPASPVVTGVQPYKSIKMDVATLVRNVTNPDHLRGDGFQAILDRLTVTGQTSSDRFLNETSERATPPIID